MSRGRNRDQGPRGSGTPCIPGEPVLVRAEKQLGFHPRRLLWPIEKKAIAAAVMNEAPESSVGHHPQHPEK
jgi:hypothetical protein